MNFQVQVHGLPNHCRLRKRLSEIDWLDLKMLESFVSILPCDWFSLSGWTGFCSRSVKPGSHL